MTITIFHNIIIVRVLVSQLARGIIHELRVHNKYHVQYNIRVYHGVSTTLTSSVTWADRICMSCNSFATMDGISRDDVTRITNRVSPVVDKNVRDCDRDRYNSAAAAAAVSLPSARVSYNVTGVYVILYCIGIRSPRIFNGNDEHRR